MTKLRNLLRCYAIGMSIKIISSAFHLSRNTVRKYVRRYQESGLTLDQLMTMSEEKLQEMFLDNQNRSRKPSPRMDELEALIPDYVKRLSRKGVTVKSLHEEYLREHPDGYKYSTFKRAVRRQKYHVRVVGHVDHLAGDQMYIDYAGDKLEIVDAETGEVRFVEVFVAILPCSHYTYCEAVWSQKGGTPRLSISGRVPGGPHRGLRECPPLLRRCADGHRAGPLDLWSLCLQRI